MQPEELLMISDTAAGFATMAVGQFDGRMST